MLTSETAAFREKNIGLILMASPTLGSYYADVLSLAVEFFDSDLARALRTNSELAQDLDRRFGPFANVTRRKHYIPNLVGKEACENFMVGRENQWFERATRLLGSHKVVDRRNAERYWIPCEQLADTDHFSIVKPRERSSPPHSFVRSAWREFKEAFRGDYETREVPLPLPAAPSESWIGDPKFLENVRKRLKSADVALYKDGRAGKTLCALHVIWDNSVSDEFSAGILWGTIRDDWKFDSVLVEWGVAAGLTRDIMLALKRRADRVRAVSNAIGEARMLLVLDNCESVADAELLSSIGSKATHLITTRLRSVAKSLSPDDIVEIPDLTADSLRPLLASARSELVRNSPEPVDFLLQSYGSSPETLLNAVKLSNTLSEDQAKEFFSSGKVPTA